MEIDIQNAEYLGAYKIKFRFSDGTENLVNFEPFLSNAKNPMTRKYLDEREFGNFELKFGDIIWNDYELCFPVWDLYQGRI